MDIGVHCCMETCKKLDFLPFTCPQCQGLFCQEHSSPASHNCCLTHGKQSERGVDLSQTCSVVECGRRDTVEVVCPHCHQSLCLTHRHPEDHSCPSFLPSQPHQEVSKPILFTGSSQDSKKTEGRRGGAKSDKLSAKVALMKLKQKADGLQSIPQEERIYYTIILPAGSRVQSAPLFFSKQWTVGKVIDTVSRKFGIQNHNDDISHSKRLVLFTSKGTPLQSSQCLYTCLDILPSGSSVTMNYV